MKKLVLLLLLFLLLPKDISAGATYSTIKDFMVGVRDELKNYSTVLLSDTVLVKTVSRALVWTSVDAGGVEVQYKFDTEAGTAFYTLPDSIVEIVHATLIRGTRTKNIKAWHPQFFEDKFPNVSELKPSAGDGNGGYPQAYNVWANTLQLFPIPVEVDSIYLKCFVEHEECRDTVLASYGADTMLIQMLPAFQEVAMAYACYLTLGNIGEHEEAAIFLARYDFLRKSARVRYFRHLDVLRTE